MNSEIPQEILRRVPTEIFANRNHVKPSTVIKRLCTTGSYHGIFPIKLANGRWDWPDVTALKNQPSHRDRFFEPIQNYTSRDRLSHIRSGSKEGQL